MTTKRFKREELSPQWIVFDAKGKTLGRLASEIAKVLRGKHRPTFSNAIDCGDGVIVINADQIQVTGGKEANKSYFYYTGHIGGQRETPYRTMLARHPGYIIEHAVRGMMPKTRIGRKQFKRLRVYAGEKHSMHAQRPINANI